MPKIYDQDLRDKVIDYLEAGNSYVSAAGAFNLALNTVKGWHKRYKSLGHCKPCKIPGRKPRVEEEVFKDYVKNNLDKTLEDIGSQFSMTASGILYHMHKNGFRYKKKSLDIKKPALKKSKNI